MTANKFEQRGFALVLGIAMLALLAVTFFWSIRSGVATLDRTRADNLADSAAYSAAVWRARTMNYYAYSNRAIVANEVLIAQAITMQSWTSYMKQFSENAATVTSWVPYLNRVTQAIQEFMEGMERYIKFGVGFEVPARSAWTEMLELSQTIISGASSLPATYRVANEVVWSTDPKYHSYILPLTGKAFSSWTQHYQGADRGPMADLVVRALDDFSKNRGFDVRIPIPFPPDCTFTEFDHLFLRFVRRGGTQLTTDFENWQSGDNAALHSWTGGRSFWGLFKKCSRTSEALPLAGGEAATVDENVDGSAYDFGRNPSAKSWADNNRVIASGYRGLSGFRELAPSMDTVDPRDRIPLLVKLPMTYSQAKVLSGGSGRLSQNSDAAKAIVGMAVGEVYFERPRGLRPTGGAWEYPTAFSPYWQARLVKPTNAEKLEASVYAQQ